jgi:hypothetical protein
MVEFDLAEAVGLIGSYVLVEMVCDSDSATDQYCMQLVGVVPPLAGVIDLPYFLAMDLLGHSKFPEELFWRNIHRITTLEAGMTQVSKTQGGAQP